MCWASVQAQVADAAAEGARLREELAASAARCDAAEANADAISQVSLSLWQEASLCKVVSVG